MHDDPKYYIDHVSDAAFPENWTGEWALDDTEAGGYVEFFDTLADAQARLKELSAHTAELIES